MEAGGAQDVDYARAQEGGVQVLGLRHGWVCSGLMRRVLSGEHCCVALGCGFCCGCGAWSVNLVVGTGRFTCKLLPSSVLIWRKARQHVIRKSMKSTSHKASRTQVFGTLISEGSYILERVSGRSTYQISLPHVTPTQTTSIHLHPTVKQIRKEGKGSQSSPGTFPRSSEFCRVVFTIICTRFRIEKLDLRAAAGPISRILFSGCIKHGL